jgi:hypothetical protein
MYIHTNSSNDDDDTVYQREMMMHIYYDADALSAGSTGNSLSLPQQSPAAPHSSEVLLFTLFALHLG